MRRSWPRRRWRPTWGRATPPRGTISWPPARIAAIQARGTTDLAGGLQAALAQVQPYAAAETISRVVLLGDGEPNEAAPILPLAQQAAAQQIAITTLGLGIDYDETLMGRIA